MSSASSAAISPAFQMGDLVRVVRERAGLIRAVAIATVALAGAVVAVLPTRYSTSASVMLDPRKNNVADLSSVLSQLPTDPSSLQNQIQILTSRDLAFEVIASLKLYDDPEFNSALKPGAAAAVDPRNWRGPREDRRRSRGTRQDHRCVPQGRLGRDRRSVDDTDRDVHLT